MHIQIQNLYQWLLQGVLTAPMGITVSTTVVVTVGTTLHVTNRLDIVTGGVTQDIIMVIAAKVILKWMNVNSG